AAPGAQRGRRPRAANQGLSLRGGERSRAAGGHEPDRGRRVRGRQRIGGRRPPRALERNRVTWNQRERQTRCTLAPQFAGRGGRGGRGRGGWGGGGGEGGGGGRGGGQRER